MENRFNKIVVTNSLTIFSGILLGISTFSSTLYLVSFISLIPFLNASERIFTHRKVLVTFGVQLIILFVTFYMLAGFWVLQTANLGFLIGLLIVLPFVIFLSPFILLKKNNNKFASVYFIAAWLVSEWIQSYFQLGSPFYNLGNNLGANPKLIQWYEFTGASGGTLWILVVNFTLYSLGKTIISDKKPWLRKSLVALGAMLLPAILSLGMFYSYEEKGNNAEVLIIHPSTDNRDVKYQKNIYELMDIYLGIMLPQISENTEYIVLPETAITNTGWVSDFDRNLVFEHFYEKTAGYPNLKLVTGAIAYEAVPAAGEVKTGKKISGIRYSEKYKTWYRTYNIALQLEKQQPVQMRTKEGLVPYQEYAPYPTVLPKILPVGIDFQFSTREPNQEVFTSRNNTKTAALICYELAFGNKFTKATRNGAETFFVLLNEGWYANAKKVPLQFLRLSVVRAIENRRSIAHSSNMGISAFVNQRGEVVIKTASKQHDFLYNSIKMNKKKTVYTLLNEWLSITAVVVSAVVIVSAIKLNSFGIKNKYV